MSIYGYIHLTRVDPVDVVSRRNSAIFRRKMPRRDRTSNSFLSSFQALQYITNLKLTKLTIDKLIPAGRPARTGTIPLEECMRRARDQDPGILPFRSAAEIRQKDITTELLCPVLASVFQLDHRQILYRELSIILYYYHI